MLGLFSSDFDDFRQNDDLRISPVNFRTINLLKSLSSSFDTDISNQSRRLSILQNLSNNKYIELKTQKNVSFKIPSTFNNYHFLKNIGNGGYSSIVLVYDENTNMKYAAKIIPIKELDEKYDFKFIQNEINILSSIHHESIIEYYDSFFITSKEGNECLVIITEYCECGTLLDFVFQNDVNQSFIKKVLFQISKAIEYLHDSKISHGDIKLENILLDKNFTPKLCDFGFAKKQMISKDPNKCCTLRYAAPELLKFGSYNPLQADIWALGMTFYVAESKSWPFEDGYSIKEQILRGKILIDPKSDLQKLVAKCIQMQPRKRPTIEDVLQDNYFQDIFYQ